MNTPINCGFLRELARMGQILVSGTNWWRLQLSISLAVWHYKCQEPDHTTSGNATHSYVETLTLTLSESRKATWPHFASRSGGSPLERRPVDTNITIQSVHTFANRILGGEWNTFVMKWTLGSKPVDRRAKRYKRAKGRTINDLALDR